MEDCHLIQDASKLVFLMVSGLPLLKGSCYACRSVDVCPRRLPFLQPWTTTDETSGFDVLVASDAIGMGLNLSIQRIIFSTLEKFDGEDDRHLTVSEIKQIAGRAGRYQSRYENGFVSAR